MASANVELVRSIFADWERGDFRRVDWAAPDIELVRPEGLEGGEFSGRGFTPRPMSSGNSTLSEFSPSGA